ncbi:mitogen-activated protein kinase kinase kinase 9 [Actinomortierella ambigua]|uniref:Mitogen-activated protein kinase kinase kinase 9 n=1 Tax=Actinomortierella ambigua TaxID=1343610 RepID=A0A9P6PPG7_9FUNG|nr:mitogen-activated protein kinase kinase kinase 9 [Actinomortierella ambigua]
MITDFAEGGTLQSAIQGKRLGDGWVKKDQISKEIAKGLAYIHSNKIIHRDLKSGNVLLTQYLEVKLCDFGLAQIKINTASSHTSDRGSAEGTLRWMAPEVLALRPKYSTKSDMYALGMVMWEMAANCTTPFQEQRDNNVVVGFVRQGDREEIPEKTPMDYRLWIERCWEQDPSRRPDAADMFDENIDDVGFASESQVSTVSITMSMVDRGGLTRESEAPIGSGNIGGSGNSDTTKSAAPHGLSANLLAKLSTLEGDDAERVRGMLSIFEGTSYNVPPPIVEELELIVTSGEQLLRDAKLGDVDAHYKLGRKYIQALGVEPRYESGKKLLELAASQGHAEARFQYSLMICFRHATGSDDDWLEEAAADGHASAATLLHFARNVGISKKAGATLSGQQCRGSLTARIIWASCAKVVKAGLSI